MLQLDADFSQTCEPQGAIPLLAPAGRRPTESRGDLREKDSWRA